MIFVLVAHVIDELPNTRLAIGTPQSLITLPVVKSNTAMLLSTAVNGQTTSHVPHPVAVRLPATNVSPLPTVISSTAPVLAVLLPSSLEELIVKFVTLSQS